MTCPQVFLECVSFLLDNVTLPARNPSDWKDQSRTVIFFFFFFLRSFSHHPLPTGWQPRSLPRTCLTFPSHPTQRNPTSRRGWDAGGPSEHARPSRACSVARAAPRSFAPQLRPTRRFPRLLRQRREVRRLGRATAAAETEAEESLRRRRRWRGWPRGLSAEGTHPLGSRTPSRAGWITTRRGLAATRWWVSVPSPGLLRRPEPRDCPPTPTRTPEPLSTGYSWWGMLANVFLALLAGLCFLRISRIGGCLWVLWDPSL